MTAAVKAVNQHRRAGERQGGLKQKKLHNIFCVGKVAIVQILRTGVFTHYTFFYFSPSLPLLQPPPTLSGSLSRPQYGPREGGVVVYIHTCPLFVFRNRPPMTGSMSISANLSRPENRTHKELFIPYVPVPGRNRPAAACCSQLCLCSPPRALADYTTSARHSSWSYIHCTT